MIYNSNQMRILNPKWRRQKTDLRRWKPIKAKTARNTITLGSRRIARTAAKRRVTNCHETTKQIIKRGANSMMRTYLTMMVPNLNKSTISMRKIQSIKDIRSRGGKTDMIRI